MSFEKGLAARLIYLTCSHSTKPSTGQSFNAICSGPGAAFFKNGQTLCKKIFGLCLMRTDGVKVNNMQLFARTVLGKFAIETMIPAYILILLYMGAADMFSLLLLASILIAQLIILAVTRNNSLIHDLLAGTVVVDYASQKIFTSTEDLIAYQKRVAAERAARQTY